MPLRNFLIFCEGAFNQVERYRVGDLVIHETVGSFPRNTRIEHVLAKVVLVNSLYSTNILDTMSMAQHIQGIGNIDRRIRAGDISLVNEIRLGHSISTSRNNNEINFYSFSSKYLNWHNFQAFPIFDNLVRRLLMCLNNAGAYRFTERFSQRSLQEYSLLRTVVDSFRTSAHLENWSYKRIDKALFIWAKYCYQSEWLNRQSRDIVTRIQNEARRGGIRCP